MPGKQAAKGASCLSRRDPGALHNLIDDPAFHKLQDLFELSDAMGV